MSEKPKKTAAFIKERGLGRAVAAFIGVYAIVFALGLLGPNWASTLETSDC